MDEIERRMLKAERLEVREAEEGPAHIVGYAAVFDQPSEDLGFIETIRQGAFARTIVEDDIRSLWNHDPNWVLGRNRAGTLALVEDEIGLRVEITPPEAQWARDLVASIRRGDVSGMSFGFSVREGGDAWEGNRRRELLDLRLWDVGPVTFPAYPQTTAAVRARVMAADGDGGPDAGDGQPGAGQGAGPGADADAARQGRRRRMRMRLDLVKE